MWVEKIYRWFQKYGRTHLPWRQTRDPYAICVSEFMLQQTQVDRVIPKYEAWLVAFPSWEKLAHAKTGEVLKLWSGLGYNSRALRLQKLAREVVEKYQGKLPSDRESLLDLPGIGPYTVAALQAFAFEQEVVVIDTNIERIVLRYFWAKPEAERTKVVALLEQVVGEAQKNKDEPFARYFFQALMDFGAAVCKARPLCEQCPLKSNCKAFATQQFLVKRPKQSHFPHSKRFYRGQLLKTLKEKDQITLQELESSYDIQKYVWPDIVASLKKDGLITVHEKVVTYITFPEEED